MDFSSSSSSILSNIPPPYRPDNAVTDGLIVSTALSIVGCALVIFTYVRWRRLRRHPASLVVIRSCLDLAFCAEMLANHLYHRNGNIPSTDISDCKGFSFVSQFLTMAAELFGLMLSIDLYICISNPFSNYRSNLRTYHAVAWLTAIALAALVLLCTEDDKPIYARDPYLDICWIRRTDSTGSMDGYFVSLFIVPVVVIYSICIVLLIVASRRLAYGLPESFEARLLVFRSSIRFVLSYILYWVTAGAVYGILALIGDTAPTEALDLVLAFALGSRGVVTFAVWMITWGQMVTCSRWGLTVKGHTTSSSAPIRKKLISQTIPTLDGNGQRNIGIFDEDDGTDLRPHLNMALRREILYYATLGIVKSVTRAERMDGVDKVVGGVGHNQLRLSRQYEEKGLFALEKHKLEVNRVNHTPNLGPSNGPSNVTNDKPVNRTSSIFGGGKMGFLRSNTNDTFQLDSEKSKYTEPLLPSSVSLQNTDNYYEKINMMGKRITSGINSHSNSHVNLTSLTKVSSDLELSSKDTDTVSILGAINQRNIITESINTATTLSLNNESIADHPSSSSSTTGTSASSSSTTKPKLKRTVTAMLESAGQHEVEKLHRVSPSTNPYTKAGSSNSVSSSSSSSTKKSSGNDFTFLDFEPHLFARMRELHGISTDDYITSLSRTRRERFSEGASGAFLYYSRCDRFIVKTMTKDECDVLLRLLQDYVVYMERHPHSLLTRYYGCHALSMYGNVMYFVVMQNMMASGGATIHERYDLKGSWINRHSVALERGQKTECRHCGTVYKVGRKSALNQCPARPNHEHEPNQTMRDMDWTYKLRLDRETAQALGDMIVRDTEFLRRHNIMDYSLILGIHRAKYRLIEALNPSYNNSIHGGIQRDSSNSTVHTNPYSSGTLHHSNSDSNIKGHSNYQSNIHPKLQHQSSFLGVLAREPSNSTLLQPIHDDGTQQKSNSRQTSQTTEISENFNNGDRTPAVVVLGSHTGIGGHILRNHIHPVHPNGTVAPIYKSNIPGDNTNDVVTPIDKNNEPEYTPLALEPVNTPYIGSDFNSNNDSIIMSGSSTPFLESSVSAPSIVLGVYNTTIPPVNTVIPPLPILGMKEDEITVTGEDMDHNPDEVDSHHHKNIASLLNTNSNIAHISMNLSPIHIPEQQSESSSNNSLFTTRPTVHNGGGDYHDQERNTTTVRHPSIQLRVSEGRNGSVVPFFSQYRGGMRATIVEGPGLYYVGIIDMLQTFTWTKWFENFFKTRILWRPTDGVSCIPPDAYASRFRKRVIGQLVDGYEEAMDSVYEEDDFI